MRGRTSVVSRGSRAPGVTLRPPRTRSAPTHTGSPPPRDYHHNIVVGCVGGAHSGGEPGVPGARSHAQAPTDTIRTPARRLTTAPRLSPPFCGGVCGWGVGGEGEGWRGARGRTAVVSRGSRTPGVTLRPPPTRSAPTHAGSLPPRDYHHNIVVGCVGGWMGVGAHHGGEPGVPGARGHDAILTICVCIYTCITYMYMCLCVCVCAPGRRMPPLRKTSGLVVGLLQGAGPSPGSPCVSSASLSSTTNVAAVFLCFM